MEFISKKLISQFSGLLFFLKRSKEEFEMVADEIGNNSLKTALNGLSDDSSYYAGELNNYLASLGIRTENEIITDDSRDLYDYSLSSDAAAGDEVMSICSHNETTLTRAYDELLKEENIPCSTLREVLLYQLNALKYTFLKVKTLNSARFA